MERVNCFDDFSFSSRIYTEWNSIERCGDASQLIFFGCRKLFYNRIADKMECGKCQNHCHYKHWKQLFAVTLGFILIPHSKKRVSTLLMSFQQRRVLLITARDESSERIFKTCPWHWHCIVANREFNITARENPHQRSNPLQTQVAGDKKWTNFYKI